jgi:glycosyltransferase involved in cell wall biosynthesis
MKIVFTSIFQSGHGGGAGRVAHELAHHFALEHDVVMVCPADQTGITRDEAGLLTYGIRSAGATEFQMPNLSSRAVRALFDFLDEFQPDIVHAHEPALMGLIGQVWAKMNRVPFVHTTHVLPSKAIEFGTSEAIHVPNSILKSSLTDYAIHSVLGNFFKNCDALIALNQSALESIREFGYKGPIYVVPNGRALAHYNHSRFADNTAEQKVLVFIGFLSDRKNQAYLLKTLKALPESYTLRLVGKPLNADYQAKLEKYIQKHDLKNVEFVGQISHEQIPEFLEEAHVFPSASKMEVQSLVVIEALASGTPVVGLSNETIDELVSEDVGAWLAKDQKPAVFAAQIERICNLPPEEYQKLCQNARERVKHLDWSNVVTSTVEAYQEILTIKLTVSDVESDMLTNLVKFFSRGDLRQYLLDVIEDTRHRPPKETGILSRVKVPPKMQSWSRVPTSTWLISGMTISVSVVGYLLMKVWGKKKE